jgi:hypothetical protein
LHPGILKPGHLKSLLWLRALCALLLVAGLSHHAVAEEAPTATSSSAPPDAQRAQQALRKIRAADISDSEKRARLKQMMLAHPYIFKNSNVDPQHEQALDAAVAQVETLLYETAVDDAPTPESKLNVIGEAPAEVKHELESDGPPLIAPLDQADQVIFKNEERTAKAPIEKATTVPEPVAASQPKKQKVKAANDPRPPGHPALSLTAQASDPTAPLVQAQITYLYSDVIRDSSKNARQILIEPVIPIPPTKLIPMTQIIRPTVPWLDSPEGKSGWGDIDLQHVFVPEPHQWGTLGFGYTATFPTADHRVLGAGKYQTGPALTVIYYRIKNWQIGSTITQSWSFAGNGDRDDVSQLTVQPIVNYLLGPWYIGIGDFTWEYDFKGNEGWNIPVGFQVGRITGIGKHKFNLSVEALVVPKHSGDGPSPKRGIKLGFVWLLPE